MEAGNYSGNNVKNRPYRWQGKGPRPAHKQPPPKRSKKMTQIEMQNDAGGIEVGKLMKRIKKTKPKVAKIAYSTTLKKVDTRTVSNNMATTSNSIHRIQVPEQSQHSYIASTSQHVAKGKTRRKRTAEAGRQLGTSDDDLIDESDSDVSISYTEQPEDGPQQQVLQQIVPQVTKFIRIPIF